MYSMKSRKKLNCAYDNLSMPHASSITIILEFLQTSFYKYIGSHSDRLVYDSVLFARVQ
jgi:hypothetical protein